MVTFDTPEGKKSTENIVGKGENAGDKHFPLFKQCLYQMKDQLNVLRKIYFVDCIWLQLDKGKILSLGKGLK